MDQGKWQLAIDEFHKALTSSGLVAVHQVRNMVALCYYNLDKFNEAIAGRDDAVVLVVSSDLPFAQGRFCSAEGIENVIPLSLMRTRGFAKDYGVLITDGPLAGITARAVVVIDENNKVVYTQLVSEIGDEPDYDAAMAAL